jgi:hypothetical protein
MIEPPTLELGEVPLGVGARARVIVRGAVDGSGGVSVPLLSDPSVLSVVRLAPAAPEASVSGPATEVEFFVQPVVVGPVDHYAMIQVGAGSDPVAVPIRGTAMARAVLFHTQLDPETVSCIEEAAKLKGAAIDLPVVFDARSLREPSAVSALRTVYETLRLPRALPPARLLWIGANIYTSTTGIKDALVALYSAKPLPPTEVEPLPAPKWVLHIYNRGSCADCQVQVEAMLQRIRQQLGEKGDWLQIVRGDLDNPEVLQALAATVGESIRDLGAEELVIATGSYGEKLEAVRGGVDLLPALQSSVMELLGLAAGEAAAPQPPPEMRRPPERVAPPDAPPPRAPPSPPPQPPAEPLAPPPEPKAPWPWAPVLAAAALLVGLVNTAILLGIRRSLARSGHRPLP